VADTDRRDLDEHVALAREIGGLLPLLAEVGDRVCAALDAGGRVYTFGNGGSAADAQHLAAELVGRYKRDRRPLPAVALSVDPSVLTCIANDYAYEDVFGRQVQALVGPRDVVIGFSTSGRSPNVVNGLAAARQVRATTVLFTGGDGGAARGEADLALVVPSTTTARIQEMHLLLLHLLSEHVDAWAAGDDGGAKGEPGTNTDAGDTRGGSA
jgi:D-sedoheptulose 7-phosphate isomerase